MSVEERFILSAIRRTLGICKDSATIEDILLSEPLDWPKVKELMGYHGVNTLVYKTLARHSESVPDDFMRSLKNDHYCNMLRNEYLLREFLRLAEYFDKEDIIFVPIKGMAFLADIYSHPWLRAMTDTDILVKKEDVNRAEQALCSLGYRPLLSGLKKDYWKKAHYHLAFSRSGEPGHAYVVDLHWALDYKRKRSILPGLWKRIRVSHIGDYLIHLLSPEDALFSLVLHNRRLGRVLSLKNVVDAVLLLEKYKDLDWDHLIKQARQNRMSASLFFILAQARTMVGFEPPISIDTSLGVPYWKRRLIYDFIGKNTFLSFEKRKIGRLYLRSHFLLYDNLWEPAEYILNIPQEQFARFYHLDPYSKKTEFLYKNRLLSIPFKEIKNLVSPKNRA